MSSKRHPVVTWLADRTSTLSSSSVFIMLWCGAIVAHYDSRMYWEKSPLFILAPLLAFVGMFFARSKVLLLIIFSVMLGALIQKMPTPDNHWFFSGLVSLGLGLGVITQIVKDRGLAPLRRDWLDASAPALRWLVIFLYLFAVFHKLNWDYLDPDLSCAVTFYKRATRTPLMPMLEKDVSEQFRHILIWGILTLEFSIPMFLLRRRTWFVGISLGFFFHMLTAAFMRHFPNIMFATYFLFIPRNPQADGHGESAGGLVSVRDDLPILLDGLLRRATRGFVGFRAFLIGQTALWTAWSLRVWWVKGTLGIPKDRIESGYFHFLRSWNTFMVVGFLIVAFLVLRNRYWKESEKGYLITKAWGLYAIPLFFVVNSFSPFWGLKTATSLAMWSNLLTTNNYSNHLIIPTDSLKVFPYMDDLVSIRQTSAKSWQKQYVRRKHYIPWVMLQRRVQAFERRRPNRPLRLVYVRDGKLVRLDDATKDPALLEPQSIVFQKFVHIKDVRKDHKGTCTW